LIFNGGRARIAVISFLFFLINVFSVGHVSAHPDCGADRVYYQGWWDSPAIGECVYDVWILDIEREYVHYWAAVNYSEDAMSYLEAEVESAMTYYWNIQSGISYADLLIASGATESLTVSQGVGLTLPIPPRHVGVVELEITWYVKAYFVALYTEDPFNPDYWVRTGEIAVVVATPESWRFVPWTMPIDKVPWPIEECPSGCSN